MVVVPPGLDLPHTVSVALATEPDAAVLSTAERERHDAFASPDRRLAFALGRTAARHLLAASLGVAPGDVDLAVGDDGAPLVPGRYVSIAHTGRHERVIAVAAVSQAPVGVDVETVGPRRPDLWRRILAPAEYGLVDALGGPTDEAQTLLWALKESVLKGQRTGLRAGARSVVLSLSASGRASAESGVSGAWEIAYARLGEAWVAVAWARVGTGDSG